MSSRLLLVPAAGRSVRMGGLLKELLPLGTRAVADGSGRMPVPVLRHVLEAGLAAGVDEVAIVTSSSISDFRSPTSSSGRRGAWARPSPAQRHRSESTE
jgi:CTP:molybdopterin cytidylyltransferase MocA